MPVRPLDPEQEFVLDAAFGRVEAAKRAVDQARRELGTVMRSVGLSASARHLKRSRQWALQLAQEAEEPRDPAEEGVPQVDDLSDSIRRLGIIEPIVVEALDDELLRVVDGHRRLRAAREAGLTSLPVSLLLATSGIEKDSAATKRDRTPSPSAPEADPAVVGVAEDAARDHRRLRFFYRGLEGDPQHRTVDAWGVVWRSNTCYLVGYDQRRAAIRTFRLDRVVGQMEDLGEGSAAPEGFSAERNVWSQLDPDVVAAMRGMTQIFQELSRRRMLDDWLGLAEDLQEA